MGGEDSVSVTRRSALGLTGAALALPAAPIHSNILEKRRMAFTPTFVDLVRNYTTTTGTGNFALGAAVSGFTSFASLQPGNSFYYSAIGVEKPAEREVGRGTLQSNGTISRDPISGTKTNFTSGTKTISLIAAAEWFNTMQAGGAGAPAVAGVVPFATKTELASAPVAAPALLTESGGEGLFVFDPVNLSAAVSADPRKALYMAPASDPTGASGAWVRKYTGPKSASWFGAKGDGTSDDAAALQAWLDSGGHLYLPAGEYFCGAALVLRRNAVIEGESYGFDTRVGSGYAGMPGSRIRFAAGVSGLDIQPQTTLTEPPDVAAAGAGAFTQEGAYNSVICDVGLLGGGGATATGVHARTFFHARNVRVIGFSGKGWDLSASSDAVGDGNSEYGNMSNSTLVDCSAEQCGSHGLHIRGRDANTCTILNFNAFVNGGWGILNESVIGNIFDKPHIAGNTLGAIKIPGATGSTIRDPYIEGDSHSNCELNANCVVFGADLTALNAPGAQPAYYSSSAAALRRLRLGWNVAPEALTAEGSILYNWDGLHLQGRGSTTDVSLVNKDGTVVARIATGGTELLASALRSDGHIYAINGFDKTVFANRFQTGGTNSVWPGVADGYAAMISHGANGLMMGGFGSAYDLSLVNRAGTVALGIVANSLNLSAAGSLTAAGSLLTTGGGIGYSTGAGGSVTQATSKSTAVTLNKLSGQITMSAAALAANTTVSFTLTNSQVAATDVLVLNHASGGTAGAYAVNAQCGAGSAVINVRNLTAASLSEAIVLRFAVIKAVTA